MKLIHIETTLSVAVAAMLIGYSANAAGLFGFQDTLLLQGQFQASSSAPDESLIGKKRKFELIDGRDMSVTINLADNGNNTGVAKIAVIQDSNQILDRLDFQSNELAIHKARDLFLESSVSSGNKKFPASLKLEPSGTLIASQVPEQHMLKCAPVCASGSGGEIIFTPVGSFVVGASGGGCVDQGYQHAWLFYNEYTNAKIRVTISIQEKIGRPAILRSVVLGYFDSPLLGAFDGAPYKVFSADSIPIDTCSLSLTADSPLLPDEVPPAGPQSRAVAPPMLPENPGEF